MAYNENLAKRIQVLLSFTPELVEKKMFGGIAFLLRGNMACGVHKDKLMVRLSPELHTETLRMPYTTPFNLTGKEMKGWVLVEEGGYQGEAELEAWVRKGVDYALTLPPK